MMCIVSILKKGFRKMKKFIGIVLAVAFLLRALPVLASTTGWLLPNAALPSASACLAIAENTAYASATEGVTNNTPFNAYVIPKADLFGFYQNPNGDDNLLASPWRYAGITGNLTTLMGTTPTTDQLIVYYSCLYGIDSDTLKAQAMAESTWNQYTNGDIQTSKANCTNSKGQSPLWNGTNCITSYGILQDKVGGPGLYTAWPYVGQSTGFAVELRTSLTRSCIDGGQQAFFDNNGTGGPNAPYSSYRTDVSSCTSSNSISSASCVELFTGCIATHFSGAWWDGSAGSACGVGGSGAQNYWTWCVSQYLSGGANQWGWPGGVH